MLRLVWIWTLGLALISATASDRNESKELEEWLKYNFTHHDIETIAKYIRKLQRKTLQLQRRMAYLEQSVHEMESVVQVLARESLERKTEKTPPLKQTDKATSPHTTPLAVPLPKKNETKTLTRFKPAVFEVRTTAKLYDRPGGEAVRDAKAGYRFTAFLRRGGWIRISGHFPHGRWEDIDRELWVRETDITKIH